MSMESRWARVGLATLLVTALAGPALAQAQDATPEQLAAWQHEMDAARAKRSTGHHIMIGGYLAFGAGVGVWVHCLVHIFGGCSGGEFFGGMAAVVGGGAVASAGEQKAHDAGFAIKWLTSHGAKPMPLVDWQHEFALAKARQSSGRKLMFVGLGVMATGVAGGFALRHCAYETFGPYPSFVTHAPSCLGPFRAAYFVSLGGAITSGVGGGRARDAGLAIKLLNAHPPAGTGVTGSEPRVERGLDLNIGPVTSLAYHVRW